MTQTAALAQLLIVTELGQIEVAIEIERAPITAANFLRYVDGGFYTGGQFHRTVTMNNQADNHVKIAVIQAGIHPERDAEKFPPIPLERTRVTGLRHTDGALSLARGEPDSAQAGFFICVGDQPELDYGGARNPDGQGFAAFGHVTAGMDVVRHIQQAPCEAQRLTPPIQIQSIRRA